MKKCITDGCNGTAAYHRKICDKCHTQIYKKKHPIKYAYKVHKQNARRRKIEHTLTLEEFEQFCIREEYLIGKGRSKESYTIDRIDPTKGYTKDNIQVLSNSDNASKGRKMIYDWQSQKAIHIHKQEEDSSQNPF